MNTPSAKLLVWAGERSACIRIIGRANFTSSLDFKALVTELRQRGCDCLGLDLSECVLMDSTFLGVLAGFGLKLRNGNGDGGKHGIELLNPSARITELLDTLGVLHLFTLTQGPVALPEQTDLCPHPSASPSKEEVTRTCIEAHQTLMDISPANAARFKDVAQFMAESLKQPKSG
jgi:anti-anti-sigma regulatory factor